MHASQTYHIYTFIPLLFTIFYSTKREIVIYYLLIRTIKTRFLTNLSLDNLIIFHTQLLIFIHLIMQKNTLEIPFHLSQSIYK